MSFYEFVDPTETSECGGMEGAFVIVWLCPGDSGPAEGICDIPDDEYVVLIEAERSESVS